MFCIEHCNKTIMQRMRQERNYDSGEKDSWQNALFKCSGTYDYLVNQIYVLGHMPGQLT